MYFLYFTHCFYNTWRLSMYRNGTHNFVIWNSIRGVCKVTLSLYWMILLITNFQFHNLQGTRLADEPPPSKLDLLSSTSKLHQVSVGLQSSVSLLSCNNWDIYCKCHLLYNYTPYPRRAQISSTSRQKPDITVKRPVTSRKMEPLHTLPISLFP